MIAPVVRLLSRLTIFASLLAIISVGAFGLWFTDFKDQPSGPDSDTLFYIAPGSGHHEVAGQLQQAGLLRALWHYELMRLSYSLLDDTTFQPKAGEFLIPARASLATIFEHLDKAKPFQHRFTVIEGATVSEVAQLLKQEERLTGTIGRFPEEGSLAPDTYFFVRGETRRSLIERMQARQEMILAEEWANRQPRVPYDTPHDALIMASIIEKETGLVKEQPIVSSVFMNRLRDKMRLQSDASVLYGVIQKEGAVRTLTRADWKVDSAWNSYTRGGLPATAIANPGRAAIKAALQPAPTPYYYFVATGNGGHHFATTLQEHNRNVKAYQKVKARQDAAQGDSQ